MGSVGAPQLAPVMFPATAAPAAAASVQGTSAAALYPAQARGTLDISAALDGGSQRARASVDVAAAATDAAAALSDGRPFRSLEEMDQGLEQGAVISLFYCVIPFFFAF